MRAEARRIRSHRPRLSRRVLHGMRGPTHTAINPFAFGKPDMRSLFAALFTLAAAAASTSAGAQGQVTVYCSILEELCRDGAALFERNTGTKVAMVRKSTGETYAQLKAEAANPRADVWWGGPGESHLQAAEEGLLE